jgi:hypothetical protein
MKHQLPLLNKKSLYKPLRRPQEALGSDLGPLPHKWLNEAL